MADFVPELVNPNDPDSIAEWARAINSLVNGFISIGEPVSEDTTRKPNGVKGHLLGSFVTVEIGTKDDGFWAAVTCTHNLNIPNKGVGASPSDLNVGWVVVRWEHDGNGVAGANEMMSCNYRTGDAVTNNSIDLRFYYGNGARNVNDDHPIYVTLWFFPTTR